MTSCVGKVHSFKWKAKKSAYFSAMFIFWGLEHGVIIKPIMGLKEEFLRKNVETMCPMSLKHVFLADNKMANISLDCSKSHKISFPINLGR